MNLCVTGFHPILFNFKTNSNNQWVSKMVAVSGRIEGRIDGVELLVTILKDAKKINEKEIKITKRAFIRDGGRLYNIEL